MQKIEEVLRQDKASREDNENMIFETMKDLVNRVKLELEAEKRDRETSEENILGLIENACTKLGALNL